MKDSKGQFAVILILMLALFMQMEGMLPNIFASREEPIILVDEVDGLEFEAQIDGKSFDNQNEVIIKAAVTNKSDQPTSYYVDTTSKGVRGILGAALVSMDEKSCFTDKFLIDTVKASSNAMALEGMLESGRALVCDFYMLPFYKENGSMKHVTPGNYILSLWYNKGVGEVIKAEFPVTITKRLGKMYIKNS
ncbi:MAG: hypothetical protein K0Q65_203 [Clostridia bacterium]|jgi:hypothetical protein|nr:hypothetical protein [Clostridia bacterium]